MWWENFFKPVFTSLTLVLSKHKGYTAVTLQKEWYTCYDLGGRAADTITSLNSWGLWGWGHAGSHSRFRSWPWGARQGARGVRRKWPVVRKSVRRHWWGGGRGLWIFLRLVDRRGLWWWMARGLDGVFAEVATRCGGVWRTGYLGVSGLRSYVGCLFGWGWGRGLLFGAFQTKHLSKVTKNCNHWCSTHMRMICLPLRTMWGLGPFDPLIPTTRWAEPFLCIGGVVVNSRVRLWKYNRTKC